MDKIITKHEFPPIPNRQWDWYAVRESKQEMNLMQVAGWGRTEQEAIEDLQRLEAEEAELEEAERQLEWEEANANHPFSGSF